MDFMVKNKYLDPTIQKAYLNGINGCIEHVSVMQEIIADAKYSKNDLDVTWFDLEDAFGSVQHELIEYSLKFRKCISYGVTIIQFSFSSYISNKAGYTVRRFQFHRKHTGFFANPFEKLGHL